MQLAEDLGIKVECRPVPEEELETFEEAGACGTAAVISPIPVSYTHLHICRQTDTIVFQPVHVLRRFVF